MANSRQQIEDRVRAFVADLEGLIRQAALEAVAESLGGSPRRGPGRPPGRPAATRGPGRPAGSLGRARGRRSPAQMEKSINALLGYIKSHPGSRMEQIAAALGTTSGHLNRPMNKLLSAKQIRRTGQKRASKYFPSGR